jgi:hypothetical protein
MKNIFKAYGDWILGAAGFAILVSMIWVFAWGILLISKNMTQAFGSLGEIKDGATFHLDQAEALDLKGLK